MGAKVVAIFVLTVGKLVSNGVLGQFNPQRLRIQEQRLFYPNSARDKERSTNQRNDIGESNNVKPEEEYRIRRTKVPENRRISSATNEIEIIEEESKYTRHNEKELSGHFIRVLRKDDFFVSSNRYDLPTLDGIDQDTDEAYQYEFLPSNKEDFSMSMTPTLYENKDPVFDTFTTKAPSLHPVGEPTNTPTAKITNNPTNNPTLETCLAFGDSCESRFSNCCQGGCSSTKTCFCQRNNGSCFNRGREDSFCCSNRCGLNSRCQCIPSGESCAVGGEFCCDGLSCMDGFCIAPPPPSSSPTMKPTAIPTTTKPTSTPTTKPTNDPTVMPTFPPTLSNFSSFEPTTISTGGSSADISGNYGCNRGEIKITIEIKTDTYGEDTSWFLADLDGEIVMNAEQGSYGVFTYTKNESCVSPGIYNFTIYDAYGDGLCCFYGDGFFKVYLDDREVLYMTSFGEEVTETLNVGFDATMNMTERDLLYLEAHNVRRKQWHESHNVSFVPLHWSPILAEESRIWAVELLKDCDYTGIEHELGVLEGENLAKNHGSGGWGQLYPPNNILRRWVEFEINRNYPANGHLTQALWRASKYLGCGESVKEWRGGYCRVQVCRYARAGNCDMASFNATYDKNWLPPMLSGTSKCGPNCAPEGCF